MSESPTDLLAKLAPRDQRGRFMSRDCPECEGGTLHYEGDGMWRCYGLRDPDDVNKPLEACPYTHSDGMSP